jgi:F420H(2)-dependent quinone reductase
MRRSTGARAGGSAGTFPGVPAARILVLDHTGAKSGVRRSSPPTIQIGALTRPVHARVATDEERARLWPRFVEFYPGYDLFARISPGRRVPIVMLEPR